MPRIEKLAFFALALHAGTFLFSYELFRARTDDGDGLSLAALGHVGGLALVLMLAPRLHTLSRRGRYLVCGALLASTAVRLGGVEPWMDNEAVRLLIVAGQGGTAAAAYWLFFSLTPAERWPWRYALAWTAGLVGKTLLYAAIGPGADREGLYWLLLTLSLALVLVVSACILDGTFAAWKPGRLLRGRATMTALYGSYLLVTLYLMLLTGWIGPFRSMWIDGGSLVVAVAVPATLVLMGWMLSGDFAAGFRRTTALCVTLVVAIVTLSVLRSASVPVRSLTLLAVCCQIAFYAIMAPAMVRLAPTPGWFSMATVSSYLALFPTGVLTYNGTPLGNMDAGTVVAAGLAVCSLFYYCTRRVAFPAAPLGVCAEGDALPLREVLSPREREVAALLVRSMTNADIARSMYLSRHTINTHVRNMCEKSRHKNREALVRALREEGWEDA